MTTINLREFYPEIYSYDQFIDLPDDVAALLCEYKLKEAAYYLRRYRYKAYYSLDRGDGIEQSAVAIPLSPLELLEQRHAIEQLYAAMSSLPKGQARRIYAHYFLGMSKMEIARAEGVHKSRITRSIEKGLRKLELFLRNCPEGEQLSAQK